MEHGKLYLEKHSSAVNINRKESIRAEITYLAGTETHLRFYKRPPFQLATNSHEPIRSQSPLASCCSGESNCNAVSAAICEKSSSSSPRCSLRTHSFARATFFWSRTFFSFGQLLIQSQINWTNSFEQFTDHTSTKNFPSNPPFSICKHPSYC